MKYVRVAAASLNLTPFAWGSNKERIFSAINKAQEEQARLLCLPELCISGYGCEDFFHCDWLAEKAYDVLEEIVPRTAGIAVLIGLPLRYQNNLYNCVAVVADSHLHGIVAKQHLAGDGVHYEPRWFKPWPPGEVVFLEDGTPLGDLIFTFNGVRVGCEICEDAWQPPRPGNTLSRSGVDIICNPSASHYARGKLQVRESYIVDGSRSFGCAYLYSNILGCESGRTIYDGDTIIATRGQIVARGKRFSMHGLEITSASIDIELNRQNHLRRVGVTPLVGTEDSEVHVDFDLVDASAFPLPVTDVRESWEKSQDLKVYENEEFLQAVTLGLFDYLWKTGHHSVVVSLSGGADSTAVSLIVYYMTKRAWRELGRDVFTATFGLKNVKTVEEAMKQVLCCVYQKTANNSPETMASAKAVAESIHATFLEFDIEPFARDYVKLVEKAVSRELTWKDDDASLQNVQARARVPGLWLLANLRRALLLATGNRSEGSVGYTTMDGDSAGGLSVIGGVDKPFLLQWLSWVETTGPLDLGSVPAVGAVTKLSPSAELRPLDRKQTDEADLMPYPVLQSIEELAIRDKKGPREVFELSKVKWAKEYSASDIRGWVTRFFRLWAINQWKRERLPISFHLDDYNTDPRSWCRYPILSSGFEEELSLLES